MLCIHGFRYLIRDGIHHSYRKLLDFQSGLDIKITDIIQTVDFLFFFCSSSDLHVQLFLIKIFDHEKYSIYFIKKINKKKSTIIFINYIYIFINI